MATHHDADIILKLYDLRRESVCRQARAWLIKWLPKDANEAKQILSDGALQENAWLRQATSYWEMAFSLANSGALDKDLLAKNCGEGLIYMLKCQHLKTKFPDAWTRTMPEAEAFTASNVAAQQKAQMFKARFAN